MTKHRTAMVVLGSFLVFITFIVNEAIRDNLKDSIDSLEHAQSMFVLQRDHAAILIEIESANRKEFETEQLAEPNQDHSSLYLEEQRLTHEALLFEEFGREFERSGRSFISLADLLNSAPVDASYRKKTGATLIALMHQEEDLQHELANTNQLFQKEGAALQNNDLPTASDLSRRVRATFGMIQSKTDDFSNALDSFSHDQFKEVSDMSEQLHETYIFVTLVSYILYAIGWAVALLGRLYGVEVSRN